MKTRNDLAIAEGRATIERTLSSLELDNEDALYEAHVECVAARKRLVERVADLKGQAVKARELDEHLEKAVPIADALDVLYGMLGDGHFLKFVVEKRERRLLGIATEIFRRMTGGRYGFALGCRIIDRESSQERGARTLSGGETFLASLALSLALVEIAVRAGGKLEALFLDEGFGTLDTVALDEAMQELERRASDGKTIGVITHIRGVTDYIDTIMRVEKKLGGSTVKRMEDAEAEELVRDAHLDGLLAH